VSFLIGLVVALAVTPVAMAVARRVGLMDEPGPLKIHEQAVPYLGGVGVIAAIVVGMAPRDADLIVPLTTPLALALALGVLDDALGLSPIARLLEQVLVGLSIAQVVDTRVPDPLDYLVVTLVVVVVMNGTNFIDGLDGLAGGIGLVATLGFVVALAGSSENMALAAAGGLLGFLVYNWPPARVYLGDGGSYLLGALLAMLLALSWRPASAWTTSIGALLFVLFPVAEVVFAFVRRARARSSPLSGDRRHSYDLLVRSGQSKTKAVVVCIGVQASLTVAGFIAAEMSRPVAIMIAAGAALVVLVVGGTAGMLTPDPR
jgi:UDP-GlcNAc:undecaprenyl-phosphate GlcNAc-1-phosphate transferase